MTEPMPQCSWAAHFSSALNRRQSKGIIYATSYFPMRGKVKQQEAYSDMQEATWTLLLGVPMAVLRLATVLVGFQPMTLGPRAPHIA